MVVDRLSCGNVQPGMGRPGWQGYPAAQVKVGADARHLGSGVDTTEVRE